MNGHPRGSLYTRKMHAKTIPSAALSRPQKNEYAEYYETYISQVPGQDVLAALEQRPLGKLLAGIGEQKADFRYAPGKWSIKEVIGHVIDAERIFAYRALRFARNDPKALAGWEQDDYMKFSPFAHLRLADLLEEYGHVRSANLHLFRSLDEEAWTRHGVANEKDVSVRAIVYIIAGHEAHHAKVLKEKYLK